jgi:hypothetical protein
MLEIFEYLIATLLADPTLVGYLTVNLPNNQTSVNLFTGPVDMSMEVQASLLYPSVILSLVGESVRTVPQGARDTQIQLDIWSRNSQLEIETIYEQVLQDLNFMSANEGSAHIFWQRLGGAVDLFESDRRVWHRSCTFTVWAIKP